MLARLIALFLALSGPLWAETARVTGGEHGDFTRLVVEAGGSGDWRFGRSADGYELALGPEVTGYDVTTAFEKIPRDRIGALWRDPGTGRLRFSLACACHAIAFEFRPGIVVIDIRSGPPPEGSAFEVGLDPPATTPAASPPPDPAGRYDWLAIARDRPPADPALPLPTGEVSLDPLRDALLAQIGRGVAEGVVEVAEGGPVPKAGANRVDEGPWSRVAIGEMPGLKAGADRDLAGSLTAAGQGCIPDRQLDIAGWGLPGPVPAQIGLARAGMLAEFDAPVPAAILRAARFHIHLGFGAEARQYLAMLGGAEADEAALLSALSRIVDGEPVEGSPFDGQESCDSAAALWTTLARRDRPLLPRTDADAVARSFSALPPHLRRHLGPPLVDAFLAAGDGPTARILRDAILRLPADSPDVALMEARYRLAGGQQAEAGEIAAGVVAGGGPAGPEATVVLVEAAFRGARVLDPKVPLALDAFLKDARGTALEPRLLRARVLAAAMTSDLATAFALLERTPETFADLWSLAAGAASDDLFLDRAARQAGSHPPLAADTARRIAERLLALGFPDLALRWLGPHRRRGPGPAAAGGAGASGPARCARGPGPAGRGRQARGRPPKGRGGIAAGRYQGRRQNADRGRRGGGRSAAADLDAGLALGRGGGAGGLARRRRPAGPRSDARRRAACPGRRAGRGKRRRPRRHRGPASGPAAGPVAGNRLATLAAADWPAPRLGSQTHRTEDAPQQNARPADCPCRRPGAARSGRRRRAGPLPARRRGGRAQDRGAAAGADGGDAD